VVYNLLVRRKRGTSNFEEWESESGADGSVGESDLNADVGEFESEGDRSVDSKSSIAFWFHASLFVVLIISRE
jgi:hypothetical protein